MVGSLCNEEGDWWWWCVLGRFREACVGLAPGALGLGWWLVCMYNLCQVQGLDSVPTAWSGLNFIFAANPPCVWGVGGQKRIQSAPKAQELGHDDELYNELWNQAACTLVPLINKVDRCRSLQASRASVGAHTVAVYPGSFDIYR